MEPTTPALASRATAQSDTMPKTIPDVTELQISAVGIGCAPVGFLKADQKQVTRLLNELLDEGVNVIDTAAADGDSEVLIGNAIAHRRDECVLVSKCGQPFDDLDGEAWSPKLIHQTIDRSLKRLKTDYLDVMLLHSCDLNVLWQGDALAALTDAQQAGKIRFLGFSGDNKAMDFAAGFHDVDVIETSINICDHANVEAVTKAALKRNLVVIAKRPLANAAWKKLCDQSGYCRDCAETYKWRLVEMQVTPEDLGFEGDPAVVWPEIALRFTLGLPAVNCAVIGTTSIEHAKANLRAAEKGSLPLNAMMKLRAAFAAAEHRSGEKWSAQT